MSNIGGWQFLFLLPYKYYRALTLLMLATVHSHAPTSLHPPSFVEHEYSV